MNKMNRNILNDNYLKPKLIKYDNYSMFSKNLKLFKLF